MIPSLITNGRIRRFLQRSAEMSALLVIYRYRRKNQWRICTVMRTAPLPRTAPDSSSIR